MVEILVVVAIIGILLAASLKGFPMIFGKQGLVGSVRTLSGKVSMARSYAVTQNYDVALLLPDNTGNTTASPGVLDQYKFNHTRLCYVYFDDPDYKFANWIDGQEWTPMANSTCAYIETVTAGFSYNSVINVDLNTACKSSAIIFQNNGSLLTSDHAAIRVIPAVKTGVAAYTPIVNAAELPKKRWNIMISAFTGKVQYLYGKEQ